MSLWWFAYPLLGCFSGFVAGLFGVGGGLIIVPFLVMLFSAQGFPSAHLVHLALGTAMATMVATSISSMRAHHRHEAVRWEIVKAMAPGLVLGTLGGSFFAGFVPTRPLAVAFTAIVCYAALQMVLDFKPKPSRTLPGATGIFLVGSGIGLVASLVAAGGGFLSIPFMVWNNVAIRQAVGTSAALGLPIAAAGTIGYLASGWSAPELPAYSLGYVHLPAFAGVAAATMLVAPFGARTAHRLPGHQLKRGFGIFLAVVATKMLHSLLA